MSQSLGRREFLRRATLVTAGIGSTATLATLTTSCGSDPGQPTSRLDAPSDLSIQVLSSSQVRLSWTDNSPDESGFEISRQAATEADFTVIATLPANTTEYVDDSVAASTVYHYRVRAFSGDATSPFTQAVSAQTPAADTPDAPVNLSAGDVTDSGVRLTWEDRAASENGYRILRRTNDVLFEETAAADATTFVVTGLSAGQLHLFSVVAFNSSGDSAPSNEVAVRTGPTAESLTLAVTAPGRLALGWSDNSGGASRFRVERKSGAGDYAELAMVPAGATRFEDTSNIPLGTSVGYRLSAVDETSLVTEGAIDTPSAPPAEPTSLVAQPAPSNGSRVLITWDAPAASAKAAAVVSNGGFEIERKTEQTAFAELVVLSDPAARSHEDPASGRIFAQLTYRVRAYNLAGFSAFSNNAAALTRAVFRLADLPSLSTIGKGARVQLNVSASFFDTACSTATRLMIHLVRVSATQIVAVVANCTHQCCTTNYVENIANPLNGQFNCPCHGSQFRLDGSVLNGPAVVPEVTFETVLFDDRVELISDRTIPQ